MKSRIKVSYVILVTLLMVVDKPTLSQFAESIRTGRPGQAIGPFSVGNCVFQTQTGFDFGGHNQTIIGRSGNYYNPNTVIRFGITERFEVNTTWAFQYEDVSTALLDFNQSGLSAAAIGSRINLFEGRNYLPAIGVQLTLKLPIRSPDYNSNFLAPKIMVIAHQKLTNSFSLIANIGIDYNGITPDPIGVYVANISYSLGQKWGVFIENYGDFSHGSFNTFLDGGLSFLLNNDLQLDLYGGTGKNDGNFSYFTSVGISWRYIKWHK